MSWRNGTRIWVACTIGWLGLTFAVHRVSVELTVKCALVTLGCLAAAHWWGKRADEEEGNGSH